tara:strand:- start:67281 stop:68009 length:729 start_codon:yes stop_codon:yes gene_type:complete
MKNTNKLKVVFDFIHDYLTDGDSEPGSIIHSVRDEIGWAQNSTEDEDISDVPTHESGTKEDFDSISKELNIKKTANLQDRIFGRGNSYKDLLDNEDVVDGMRDLIKRMDETDHINNRVSENIKIRDLNTEIHTLKTKNQKLKDTIDKHDLSLDSDGILKSNTSKLPKVVIRAMEKEGTGITLGDDGKIISVNLESLKPIKDYEVKIKNEDALSEMLKSEDEIKNFIEKENNEQEPYKEDPND